MSEHAKAVPRRAPAQTHTPRPVRLLQRKCACGQGQAHDEGGECAECRAKRLGMQRKASRPGALDTVPPIVDEVLAASGQPLDLPTRLFMEQRFGHDFSRVRIHTDGQAAASAEAVNAVAYTVGRDVVFGAGQYAPESADGKRLLAHELTHVVQQGIQSPSRKPDGIAAPDDIPEHEASRMEHAVLASPTPQTDTSARTPHLIARQALPAEPAPEPAPFLDTPPANDNAEAPEQVPGAGRFRAMPDPFDTSFEAMLERARRARFREEEIQELETPVATLDRGGRPPEFVTLQGMNDAMDAQGMFRFRSRAFHILDAIEFQVSQVQSEKDLSKVLVQFLGYPTVTTPGHPLNVPQPGSPLLVPAPPFVIPRQMDPGGVVRMQAYASAVARRTANNPRLATSRLVPARVPEEARRRGCMVVPAAPLGGDPLADLYAQMVTGGSLEYRVTTPQGEMVQYDGLIANTVYECKCGFGRIVQDWLQWRKTGDPRFRWAERALDDRTEQMLRQRRVANACGLTLRYVVSNAAFAAILQQAWNGDPVVITFPWEPCD